MAQPVRIPPALGGATLSGTARPAAGKQQRGPSFAGILQREMRSSKLNLSSHARERLAQRGIQIDADEMGRLEEAFDLASKKGVNASLVLLGDLAFIVDVKDRRIVTAMEARSKEGKVFTNIDGAILA